MCMAPNPADAHNVPEWTLGDRLGKALDHAGLSMGEMADFLECSRNTVSNYVNNHTKVPGAVLKLWAIHTGVPLEWLRTGETPIPQPPGEDFRAAPITLNPPRRTPRYGATAA